nr:TIGR04222 domain-containing membrane protein [uncultured Carboxylicivirga sp.]
MQDFLYHIKGTNFLQYYYIYGSLLLLIGWLVSKRDNSTLKSIPDPSLFSYIDLAYIRGGVRDVISVVLYEMVQMSHLEMTVERKSITFNRKDDAIIERQTNLQKVLWDYLNNITSYNNIVRDNSAVISNLININISKVQRESLVVDEYSLVRIRIISICTLVLALLPGVMKLIMGIQNHKPVIFLILELLFIIIVFLWLFYRKKPHNTRLGHKFIAKAKQRYDWLKSKKDIAIEEELIAVEVFGLATFFITNKGRLLPDKFDRQTNTWVWFGGCSGCGDSSGSGCSSGCGSSCSGGCSSGCGGCGGCGGD